MTKMKRYWRDANGLSRVTFLLLICLLSIQTMGAYRKGTLHSSDQFDIIWDAGNSRISFKIGVTETMHLSATALTLTNASSIINADSAQVDNVEDQAGTGPPTYPHGQSVTGTITADAVQADDVSDKAGTGAFGASQGVSISANKNVTLAAGTGSLQAPNLKSAGGILVMTLAAANITAKGNLTLDHASGVVSVDKVQADHILDEAGAAAFTADEGMTCAAAKAVQATYYKAQDGTAGLEIADTTGNITLKPAAITADHASGILQVDKLEVDTIEDEAGVADPDFTHGLTCAINKDVAISGTGAFKGGHIEAADGTVAMDLADASGDVTCKGDIEVATGFACLADATVTNVESPFTVDTDDYLILVDASGGAVSLTFPVTDGYTYHVKLIAEPGANTVTLQGAAGTIDGAATNTTALVDQYDSVTVVADGVNLHLR